jgi:outer membrane protein assembly factor BamB
MKASFMVAVVGLLACSARGAEPSANWPRFRGPNGSGVAEGEAPPVQLGPEKNVAWKVPVPSGLSSPIVSGERLVLTAFDGGKLYTIAYDRADGRELWRAAAPTDQIEPFNASVGSPAAPTPATDGERIVAYFGSCGLMAYDLSGTELWRAEIPVSSLPGDFGTSASPIIADGLVIVVRDELKDPRILAFDAATGAPRWERKRPSPASYCTPVVWDTPEGKQVAAAGHARMVGYDLATGDERWTLLGLPSGCCTSPVAVEGTLYFAGWSPGGSDDPEHQMPAFDNLLAQADGDQDGKLSRAEAEKAMMQDYFASLDTNQDGAIGREEWDAVLKFMTEGENSAFALRAGGTGDLADSHLVWKQTKGMPYVASAIVYGGQYVMVRDGGIVTAFDLHTGDELYRERAAAEGSYYASPVAANGHIYFTSLEEGAVTVLKAGAEAPVVVAENPPLGERVAATPAIASDTLYIRTDKHLYAFAEAR